MLKALNAPIFTFVLFVNQVYYTDEEVVIILIDDEDVDTFFESEKEDDEFIGKYWRQEEEPHLILIRKTLSVFDTISVLAHEYAHHLIWEPEMVDMTDDEIHELEEFDQLWEEITAGCLEYMSDCCEEYDFMDTE